MSDKPGNKADPWLEDESSVSRAYGKLKKPEPPVHLDERILAQARRVAASEDTTVVRVHRWRKWTMPAALAATVVFAVPLVVRVFDDLSSPDFEFDREAVTMSETTAVEAPLADSDIAREISAAPMTGEQEQQPMRDQPVVSAVEFDEQPEVPAGVTAAPSFETRETQLQGRRVEAAPAPTAAPVAAEPRSPSSADFSQPAAADDVYAGVEESDRATAADKRELATSTGRRLDEYAVNSSPKAESYRQRDAAVAADAAPMNATTPMAMEQVEETQRVVVTGNRLIEPEPWLVEIARLHDAGRVRTARRELGAFLTAYPDYELPDYFPLQAKDAIYDEDSQQIVPEAESWLRGIGQMAERGDIDQARMQLAEFLARYPDYPLPEDFPLRREDASIER
ncbi:MAG: hypothetical protein OEQ74_05480 [Gammaproteobacteria bacterium]|nr:hypothetical protein [Gammaproteobacteria bacterium]